MPTRRTANTRTAKASAAATRSEAFAWRNIMACVATYNVLEHDDKMDQFEDVDFPFGPGTPAPCLVR